jgi:hypothetical protein
MRICAVNLFATRPKAIRRNSWCPSIHRLLAAVEAFNVLRIVIFGDEAGTGVLAGGIRWMCHRSFSTDLTAL